jgi:glycerate 2-kinase
VPRLVAAPDKFRGTATATDVTAAICAAARAHRWSCAPCPMSDGGEGFVAAMGGERRTTTVRGPLGAPVDAVWALRDDGAAILESASAAGRALLPHPRGEETVAASTYGVGELVGAALAAGATSVIVGCGGTAATDGGRGLVEALEDLGAALGAALAAPLVAASDVDALFLDAARSFGPQKGATPRQVVRLESRLRDVARHYLDHYGIDVTTVRGAGAAGGLAGGLVALGATVVSGAQLVADAVGLTSRLAEADAVVTGEGRLDAGTLEGKVVTAVLTAAGSLPTLVVTGRAEPAAVGALHARATGPVDVVELDGADQRAHGTTTAIETVVRRWLDARG